MKLNIRLPDDDGPNPYDSKTPFIETQPRWLWDWKWWLAIAVLTMIFVFIRNH